jgi:two-component system nitrate/nitrite response regulator NarL
MPYGESLTEEASMWRTLVAGLAVAAIVGGTRRVRVLVGEDHPMYRDGVVRALRAWPELEVVGEAGDGRTALEEIKRLQPDVALLDMRMPELEGPQIMNAIQREGLETKVIMLSVSIESAAVYDAISAGAKAFLSKDAGAKAICEAVTSVARGATVLTPELQGKLVGELQDRGKNSHLCLSDREHQVLRLIAEGRSTPEIAADLHVAPATVKTHLRNLYEKLGVSERAAAVAEAMRRGLLE